MIYSGGPLPREIPSADLVSFTFARAHEWGERPALIDGLTGASVSYTQLQNDIRRVAAGLAAHGFARGDTLAIFMPNGVEYPSIELIDEIPRSPSGKILRRVLRDRARV